VRKLVEIKGIGHPLQLIELRQDEQIRQSGSISSGHKGILPQVIVQELDRLGKRRFSVEVGRKLE
jgi:hypothetical protein